MFILGNLFIALGNVINLLLTIIYWLILIRALLSWVSPDPFNPIVRFLYSTTEPLLEPIRRLLPPSGIDLSPIIVFIIIIFLRPFLVQSLYDIGRSLR